MKLNILLAAILISLLFIGVRQATNVRAASVSSVNQLIVTSSPSDSSSPTASPSESPSVTPSESPSATASPTETPSISPSPTPSESASPSPSETASPSPSESSTPSPSVTPTPSESPSASPSQSPSESPSGSPSSLPSTSPTPFLSPTPSPTAASFNLSGTVNKRGFFHRNDKSPDKGVTVIADNFMGVDHHLTQTDDVGHYSMLLNKGLYFIHVFDPNAMFITPVLSFVNLNSNKSNVNFTGLLFDSPF